MFEQFFQKIFAYSVSSIFSYALILNMKVLPKEKRSAFKEIRSEMFWEVYSGLRTPSITRKVIRDLDVAKLKNPEIFSNKDKLQEFTTLRVISAMGKNEVLPFSVLFKEVPGFKDNSVFEPIVSSIELLQHGYAQWKPNESGKCEVLEILNQAGYDELYEIAKREQENVPPEIITRKQQILDVVRNTPFEDVFGIRDASNIYIGSTFSANLSKSHLEPLLQYKNLFEVQQVLIDVTQFLPAENAYHANVHNLN